MFYLKIIKEIMIIITSVIGGIVAIIGLNTWKAQQRGKIAFELSRRLLSNTYKLRDLIKHLRSPYMSGGEMENPPDESPFINSEEGKRYYRQYSGYKKRLTPLEKTKNKILVDLTEAEALWGAEIREKYDQLFSTINELVVEIDMYLLRLNPEEHAIRFSGETTEQTKTRNNLMYRSSKNDEFNQKISKNIEEIENLIRPHLKYQK